MNCEKCYFWKVKWYRLSEKNNLIMSSFNSSTLVIFSSDLQISSWLCVDDVLNLYFDFWLKEMCQFQSEIYAFVPDFSFENTMYVELTFSFESQISNFKKEQLLWKWKGENIDIRGCISIVRELIDRLVDEIKIWKIFIEIFEEFLVR